MTDVYSFRSADDWAGCNDNSESAGSSRRKALMACDFSQFGRMKKSEGLLLVQSIRRIMGAEYGR